MHRHTFANTQTHHPMMRYILLFLLAQFTTVAVGQLATNRMKAHYRLTQKRLDSIESKGFRLSASDNLRYHVKGFNGPFKFLATLDKGVIRMDPWSIKSDTTNQREAERFLADADSARPITTKTPADMYIDLKRERLGQATRVVKIPYQAWVFSANTIAVKVRPSATDSAGNKYSENVSTSFNLGLTFGRSFGTTTFTHRTQISTSHTFGLGLGFSAASLSKELLYRPVDVSSAPSNLILSPNVNYTVARNEIGLVLAAGIDTMVGSFADSWLYQNRFFWGFGLSFGLKA